MQDIVKTRLFLFLIGLIVVPLGTVLVILFAKGYRPDLKKGEIRATGLLVAHSYPEGAQVHVNGELKSATNTTVNLSPGNYEVRISKDGYNPWIKDLVIQPEIVTRATAVLFPSVPTLKPITTEGAARPVLSPDGTKVTFTSMSGLQLFILDLSESPLGLLNREFKLIRSSTNYAISAIRWSPDSRQVLTQSPVSTSSAYLTDIFSQELTNVSSNLSDIISEWNQNRTIHESQKFASLPDTLQTLLSTASANLIWSPREDKLLYTATASAILPDGLKKPLPGSSTQPQTRQLIPGQIYVYDLAEDRNFAIGQISVTPTPQSLKKPKTQPVLNKLPTVIPDYLHPSGWAWFPTSSHLYRIEDNKIVIVEYDNQNPTVIYAGPLREKIAIPYPSARQMLILTNLSTTPGSSTSSGIPNLYALTLR